MIEILEEAWALIFILLRDLKFVRRALVRDFQNDETIGISIFDFRACLQCLEIHKVMQQEKPLLLYLPWLDHFCRDPDTSADTR